MLLAIEQGNTNSLFAVHDGDHWIAQWRSATEPNRTADEYAVWLSQYGWLNGRQAPASWRRGARLQNIENNPMQSRMG